MTQGLKIDEGDPRAWRKLAATLGVVLVLFAPACQANIDTDDDVQTEDDGDVDLDDDTVQDDDADVDVDVEEDDDSGL